MRLIANHPPIEYTDFPGMMWNVTLLGVQAVRHAGRGAFADVWLGVRKIKAIEWLSSYLDIPTQT